MGVPRPRYSYPPVGSTGSAPVTRSYLNSFESVTLTTFPANISGEGVGFTPAVNDGILSLQKDSGFCRANNNRLDIQLGYQKRKEKAHDFSRGMNPTRSWGIVSC